MGEKIGWFGEKASFFFSALFSLMVVVQAGITVCRGGVVALMSLVGLLGAAALVWLGLYFLKPNRGFPVVLFALRFALALCVILVFGAVSG